VIPEIAHHMALVPLLWLGALGYYGQRRPALWWATALVLGISWLADTAAHWLDPWLVSTIYPALQALTFAAVLLPARALGRFAGVLGVTGLLAILLVGVGQPDVFLHTVAWTGLVVVAWPYREIRAPVLVTFGVGWLAWVAYSIAPGWATWGTYQGLRAIGLGVFCWAAAPHRVRT
jgi:hypothetical protein